MARAGRHGAEGVRAARREGVEAGGQQEDEQRPVVRLRPEARSPRQRQQAPHEVPAAGSCSGPPPARRARGPHGPCPPRGPRRRRRSPGGQEVSPDVGRLVGHLEGAEDAVPGRAAGAAIAGQDAVLPEHLCGAGGAQGRGAPLRPPRSLRETSASRAAGSGLEVSPAPKPSQVRAAPYRRSQIPREQRRKRGGSGKGTREGVRWGRREEGDSGEGSPAGSLESRGTPAGRSPPRPRPAARRGEPGDAELVRQAPHPRDLVDSQELGQLETEHGGPAAPRRDLETKRGVRASGICPHPRAPSHPGPAGAGRREPEGAVPAGARGSGRPSAHHVTPVPAWSAQSRVRGAAQFQPGTDRARGAPQREGSPGQ